MPAIAAGAGTRLLLLVISLVARPALLLPPSGFIGALVPDHFAKVSGHKLVSVAAQRWALALLARPASTPDPEHAVAHRPPVTFYAAAHRPSSHQTDLIAISLVDRNASYYAEGVDLAWRERRTRTTGWEQCHAMSNAHMMRVNVWMQKRQKC